MSMQMRSERENVGVAMNANSTRQMSAATIGERVFVYEQRKPECIYSTKCSTARTTSFRQIRIMLHAKTGRGIGAMMLLLASDLRRCRHFVSYRLLSLLTERVSVKLVIFAQPLNPIFEADRSRPLPCLWNHKMLGRVSCSVNNLLQVPCRCR